MTIKNRYPLPWIDDLLDQFRKANMFSNIDLGSGYHQVRIKDEDILKTAFRTCYGHYNFVIIPFGLRNTLAAFMCLMNNILSNYLDNLMVVFIWEILIYSKNGQEHKEHLNIIMHVLREQQLYVNLVSVISLRIWFNTSDTYCPKMESLSTLTK